MKVYHGNLDGRRFALIAADSKAHCRRLLQAAGWRISAHTFNDFFGETGNKEDIATALAEPYTVFLMESDFSGKAWKKANP